MSEAGSRTGCPGEEEREAEESRSRRMGSPSAEAAGPRARSTDEAVLGTRRGGATQASTTRNQARIAIHRGGGSAEAASACELMNRPGSERRRPRAAVFCGSMHPPTHPSTSAPGGAAEAPPEVETRRGSDVVSILRRFDHDPGLSPLVV